mmetsp:Transcript_44731/g.50685  ORF Transcript_44731/g.50685 Transcript_44731/m.50685 type:complete len:245 (-) Transcript_44731:58-792(-)
MMTRWRSWRINNCRIGDALYNMLMLLLLLLLPATIIKTPSTMMIRHTADAFHYQQQRYSKSKNKSNRLLVSKIHRSKHRSKFIGHSCWYCSNDNGIMASKTKEISTSTTSNRIITTMTDERSAASYDWFTIGDRVQVVEDVYANNNRINLRDRIGTVIETWQCCDVDTPTTCDGGAVRVLFDYDDENHNINSINDNSNDIHISNTIITGDIIDTNNVTNTKRKYNEKESLLFYFYFAEDELIKL